MALFFIANSVFPYPKQEATRTVNIKIAVERGLKTRDNWEIEMLGLFRLIRGCSQMLNDRVGIELKINQTAYWNLNNKKNFLPEILNDLRKQVLPEECDIILGIVPRKSINNNVHGISDYYRGYILLGFLEDNVALKYTILHELCHIFGGVHLNEPGSIMSNENFCLTIDDFTAKTILLNKERPFHPNCFPVLESDLDEAVSLFEQRADLNLGEAEVHGFLASLYLEKQAYEQAAKACLEALRLNPHAIDISTRLGSIYLKQGENRKAEEEYKKALKLSPKSPEIHYNLGLCYKNMGMNEKAKSKFLHAVKIDSRYPDAHAELGCIYFNEGEFDQAITELRTTLEICPDYSCGVFFYLATALIYKMKSEVSNTASSKTKSTISDRALELFTEAKALCKKALAINSDLPEAHNILGFGYFCQARNKEAEAEFLKALELYPEYIHVHFNLGVLYFNNNQFDKAAFHLRRILEIEPSSGMGFRILEQIFQR